MRTESEPFGAEDKINPETKVKVFELGQAPGFFIPLPFESNSPNIKQELLKSISIHNAFLAGNIPVFWRSFGLVGYLTKDEDFNNLKNVLNDYGTPRVLIGLSLNENSGSFVINFSTPGLPELKFYDLGSSAVIAACRANLVPNNSPYFVTKIGSDGNDNGNSVYYCKGIPLQIMTESDLWELLFRLENQEPQNNNILTQLKLSPLSSDIDQIDLPSAFILKIDVNDSTRKNIENGEWLRTEEEISLFMGEFLLKTGCLPQIHLIDTIGESTLIICDQPPLIPLIYQALRTALGSFPNITVKAVGKRLDDVTLYFSGNKPVFYSPFVGDKFWRPIEQKYKKQSGRRPGTFLISSQY